MTTNNRHLPPIATAARRLLIALANGERVDQPGWLRAGNGWRLAARAAELRACGWRLERELVETDAGGRRAVYSLAESEQRTARDMLREQAEAMARSVARAGGAA